MTRKRLWSLTALSCALLTVPSIPRIPFERLHLERVRLPPLGFPQVDPRLVPSPGVAGAVALLLALATLLIARRRRRTPPDMAVALARRGHPVAAIARRTRLSQDAVRDLLGGEPMAVSTAREGRLFRSRKTATPAEGPSFAEELSERSFDAKA